MKRELAPRQSDALRRREPGHRPQKSPIPPDEIAQLKEAKTIFATIGPEILEPLEFRVINMLLNDTKIRRSIAEELGVSLNEVLLAEDQGFPKLFRELPRRLGHEEWEFLKALRRQKRR